MRDMACSTSQGLTDILQNMSIFCDASEIRVRLGIDYGKINISCEKPLSQTLKPQEYSCQTPDTQQTKNLNADMYTTNQLVSTISIFGDTVNTAARMEQTCLPYMVHLTRAAAIRLVEEINLSAEDDEEKITEDSIHWSEMQVS